MLNETWRLLQALERNEIKRSRKHKRIQTPGRTLPCLRVCLDEAGCVGSVEDIGIDEWPTWTVMEGNQNSFPVVRVQESLLKLPRTHEAWAKLGYDVDGRRRHLPADGVRLDTLATVLNGTDTLQFSDRGRALWARLRDKKAKELSNCVGDESTLEPVSILALRFKHAAEKPDRLLRQVAEVAIVGLRQGRLNAIGHVEQLMVGKGPPDANDRSPTMTIQLAFDIEATENTPGLYSSTVRDRLIAKLPQDPSWDKGLMESAATQGEGTDALTGEPAELEQRTFPKVALPVPSAKANSGRIGRKLFPMVSMFSEARCNTRYGMTDAGVFPVAKSRAINLREALEEITADNRREKNWQHVASGRFDTQSGRKMDRPDLLIAYIDDKPMLNAKSAGYFGRGSSVTEAKFEADAAAVCEAFRGVIREKPDARLNLFLIREVSKGQAQVVLAESPTVNEVLSAAERWQWAARENVPDIILYLQPLRANSPEVRDARPSAPYPDQVVRLLSCQWVRDGSSTRGPDGRPGKANQAIVGPGLGEVLSLMLRTEGKWEPAARRMLELLLSRVGPLLIGLYGAKHAFGPRHNLEKHEPFFDYPRDSRETALRATAVLGILLDALNRKKEVYMNDTAFQLGRLLAMADTLHREYCLHVRDGSIPPQLIGNALMPAAADNPEDAIDRLRERILIYQAWATKSSGEEYRLAKWAVAQIGEISHAVKRPLPTQTDRIFRAELLLGYMARSPKENE